MSLSSLSENVMAIYRQNQGLPQQSDRCSRRSRGSQPRKFQKEGGGMDRAGWDLGGTSIVGGGCGGEAGGG